jgi:hypothetical protein
MHYMMQKQTCVPELSIEQDGLCVVPCSILPLPRTHRDRSDLLVLYRFIIFYKKLALR